MFNNPLSFTDPSGYFAIGGIEIGGVFGQMADQIGFHLAKFDYWAHTDGSKVASIGSAVIVASVFCIATAKTGPAACAAASGARSTWLSGDIKQGVKAAAIAYVSASIAAEIGEAETLGKDGVITISQTEAAVLHGLSQGHLSVIGAGKFTIQGYLAGFVSGSAGHAVGQMSNNIYADVFLSGTLGGVTSKIAGGSFSDGFMTAAMVRIFNEWNHKKAPLEKWDCSGRNCRPKPQTDVTTKVDGNYHEYRIKGKICSLSTAGCNPAYADKVFAHVNENDIPLNWGESDLGSGDRVLFWRNPIRHSEFPTNRTSLNATQEGHTFHPGTVEHRVYFENKGLYYEIIGTGSGNNPAFNNEVGIFLFRRGVEDVVNIYGE